MASPTTAFFSVRRHEPVLVAPAHPTPYELKPLSDVDDQEGLRFQMPMVLFYRSNHDDRAGRDPARVIRDALAKALVHYYPFAGRIREGPGRKLVVECTGEGVLFVEADADVGLEEFGDALPPAPPLVDGFFYPLDGSQGVVTNCPLFLIQVTRLMCGGFVFSVHFTHVMTDAVGLMLFVNAVADIARGAAGPAVPPVWARELLSARTPPRVTHAHPEYDEDADDQAVQSPMDADDMVYRWFRFGPREMAAMRKHVPPHLRKGSSTFELLAACLWRSRTVALGTDRGEEVRLICVVDARAKCRPPMPAGYYGNVLAFPAAISRAEQLCRNPLGYALELVRKLKSVVTDEYMRSVADLMVVRGRPAAKIAGGFLVSDTTRANLEEVDFGWGKAVCGGVGAIPSFTSFFVRSKNSARGDGTMVPVCLPKAAMERFTVEIERMTTEPFQDADDPVVLLYGLSRL